ncbi:hypothetical protein Bbelb_442260, partial [Branchiostoma belcheri]
VSPGGQVWQECGSACSSSCRYLSEPDSGCTEDCVAGCNCPPGLYQSESGPASPRRSASVSTKGRCISHRLPLCWATKYGDFCESGVMSCEERTFSENNCTAGMEYFDCEGAAPGQMGKACEETCGNIGMECLAEQCVSGCQCPHGLVRDGNECVLPENCRCEHNGQMHEPGQTISVDCNSCTCRQGVWSCTTKDCAAQCSMLGTPTTPPLMDYCYNQTGSFRIHAEKTACNGLSGNVCARKVTCDPPAVTDPTGARQGRPRWTHPGSEVAYTSYKFNIYRSGFFTIVKVENGIDLYWDNATRLYIKAWPNHRGRLCGMCGNFDGNQINDFNTPELDRATTVQDFANSWKASSSCPDVEAPLADYCALHPHRQAWAHRHCNIILSDTFRPCHYKVDPEPYYEACVQDSCSCDSGGDCECFCTAVAAYGDKCNTRDVHIRWRTHELCPTQCEDYNWDPEKCEWHYDPCGTSCPATCEDPYPSTCDLQCMEGCHPKCPNGTVLYNGKCIPPMDCPATTTVLPTTTAFLSTTEVTTAAETTVAESTTVSGTTAVSGTTTAAKTTVGTPTGSPSPTFPTTTETTTVSTTTQSTAPPTTMSTPVSTTTQSTAPPTTVSSTTAEVTTPCEHTEVCYWTSWINSDKPSIQGSGDNETLAHLLQAGISICMHPSMIECRTSAMNPDNMRLIPVEQVDQDVTCDVDQGFLCQAELQDNPFCLDYEVRLYCCSCGGTVPPTSTLSTAVPTTTTVSTTAQPTTTETTTVSTTAQPTTTETTTVSTTAYLTTAESTTPCEYVQEMCEWKEWMNKEYPNPSNPNQNETYANLRDMYDFCETPMGIQCRVSGAPVGTPFESMAQEGVTCDMDSGLYCDASQLTGIFQVCYDYEIRVKCCWEECVTHVSTTTLTTTSETTTAYVSPTTTKTTTVSTAVPTTTAESISSQPTTVMTPTGSPSPTQPPTTESTTISTTALPTTTESTTVSTTAYPTTTESTTPCEHVQEMCEWKEWMNKEYPSPSNPNQNETYANLRDSYDFCETPMGIQCQISGMPMNMPFESVAQEGVTCDMENGLYCDASQLTGIFQVCYDYEIRVKCCSEECVTPTPVSTTTLTTTTETTTAYVSPTTTETTTVSTAVPTTTAETTTAETTTVSTTTPPITTESTTPCEHVQEMCEWKEWMNKEYPSPSNPNQNETYANLRDSYDFCETPMGIQCQISGMPMNMPFESVAQEGVTCDMDSGLYCDASQLTDFVQVCYDYEIRVKCCWEECFTTVPTTTLTTTSETTTAYVSPTTTETTTVSTAVPTTTTETTTVSTAVPTTTTETTTVSTTTYPTTAESTTPCEHVQEMCEWKEWMNKEYPSPSNPNQNETYANLRDSYDFCETPMGIQCQISGMPMNMPFESVAQEGVTCDMDSGLYCDASQLTDFVQVCYDYEIRVKCCWEECVTHVSTTTLTTTSETTTAYVSPTTTKTTTVSTAVPTTTAESISSQPTTVMTPTGSPSPTQPPTTTESTTVSTTTPTTKPTTTAETEFTTIPGPTTTEMETTGPTTKVPPITTESTTVSTTAPPTTTESTTVSTTALPTTTESTTVSTTTPTTKPTTTVTTTAETEFTTPPGPTTTELETTGPTTKVPPTTTETTTVSTTAPPTTTESTTAYVPPSTTESTTAYVPPSTTESTTAYVPPSTTESTTAYVPPSTTESTTAYVPPSTTESTTVSTTTPPITTETTTVSTTTPPTTTPTSCGYVCNWTDWMNSYNPSTDMQLNDVESLENLHNSFSFCETPMGMECRYAENPNVDFNEHHQPGVTCDVGSGLLCESSMTSERVCMDYEVRVQCCHVPDTCKTTEQTTTATPTTTVTTEKPTTTIIPTTSVTTEKPTTSIATTTESITTISTTSIETTTEYCQETCVWSEWMNSDYPGVGVPNDNETYAHLRESSLDFCQQPDDIECRLDIAPNADFSVAKQSGVECDVNNGLLCLSKLLPRTAPACYDYAIRVKCCSVPAYCTTMGPTGSPSPTIPTTQEITTTGTTTISTTAPPTTTETTTVSKTAPPTTTETTTVSTTAPPTTTETTTVSTTAPPTTTPFIPPSTTECPDVCVTESGQTKQVGDVWYEPGDQCERSPYRCDLCGEIVQTIRRCPVVEPPSCANGLQPIDVGVCCPEYQCPCECKGYGDPHYFTFDGEYFYFQGEGEFILARDTNVPHDFEVRGYNVQCTVAPITTCTKEIKVIYNGNTIELKTGHQVLVNGSQWALPFKVGGCKVTQMGFPLKLEIESLHVTVVYDWLSSGFYISVPPSMYSDKTEGLCGPCNNNKTDDCKDREGNIMNDYNNCSCDWKVETPGSPSNSCIPEPKPTTPTPCDQTPCEVLSDPEGPFGACHDVVDYEFFYQSCRYDTGACYSECQSLGAYAYVCQRMGVCVDWRGRGNNCSYECEEGKVYKACSCVKTCENMDVFNASQCSLAYMETEGCFCPEDMVLHTSSEECISEDTCNGCEDENGMPHAIGDTWIPHESSCEECTCTGYRKTECNPRVCPTDQTIPKCGVCESQRMVEGSDPCCPTYECVCDLNRVDCPEVVIPTCEQYQYVHHTNPGECRPEYECRCNSSQCPTAPACEHPKGYILVSSEDVCGCVNESCVCRENTCSPAPECPPNKHLVTVETSCCPHYNCSCNACPTRQHLAVLSESKLFDSCKPDSKDALSPPQVPGYVIHETEDDCGCVNSSCICDRSTCPAPPTCGDNKNLVTIETECCPEYRCECKECPEDDTRCRFGEIQTIYMDECCRHTNCTPEPVCVYQNTTHQPGTSWTDPNDNCVECQCLEEIDLETGFHRVSCDDYSQCEVSCPACHTYQERSGECCGECVKTSCCVLDGEDLMEYPAGSNWTSPENSCSRCDCSEMGEQGQVWEHCYAISCPQVPTCPTGMEMKNTSSADGCCTIYECKFGLCANRPDYMQLYTKVDYLHVDDCVSLQPVNITSCAGRCASSSMYEGVDLKHTCECCHEVSMAEVSVPMECEGTTTSSMSYTYRQITACDCDTTECEVPTAQP